MSYEMCYTFEGSETTNNFESPLAMDVLDVEFEIENRFPYTCDPTWDQIDFYNEETLEEIPTEVAREQYGVTIGQIAHEITKEIERNPDPLFEEANEVEEADRIDAMLSRGGF